MTHPVDRVGDLVGAASVAVMTVDGGAGGPVAGRAVAAVAGLVPHGVAYMRPADREVVIDREVLHAVRPRVLEADVVSIVVVAGVMTFLGDDGGAGGRCHGAAGNSENQCCDEYGKNAFDQEMPPYLQRSLDGLAMVY